LVDLSASLEDYLEAIYILNKDKKVVRVKEVAEFLDVKTPSVVDAVSKLSEKDLVIHEKYGYLTLSKKGNDTAKTVYGKHEHIFKFLNEVLGMDDEISQKDACVLEHHISKATMDKMIKLIKFLESNPKQYKKWIKNFNDFIQNDK
jgi:DtxR family Mn-dependent transcriptional regulator